MLTINQNDVLRFKLRMDRDVFDLKCNNGKREKKEMCRKYVLVVNHVWYMKFQKDWSQQLYIWSVESLKFESQESLRVRPSQELGRSTGGVRLTFTHWQVSSTLIDALTRWRCAVMSTLQRVNESAGTSGTSTSVQTFCRFDSKTHGIQNFGRKVSIYQNNERGLGRANNSKKVKAGTTKKIATAPVSCVWSGPSRNGSLTK